MAVVAVVAVPGGQLPGALMELPPVMDNHARTAMAAGDRRDRRAVAHTGLKNGEAVVASGRQGQGRRSSQPHSAFRRALITSCPPPERENASAAVPSAARRHVAHPWIGPRRRVLVSGIETK